MNTSLYISSGALQAYQQKIDTSANNVANVNTVGFKRKDQSFSEILASQINNQGRAGQEAGRLTPQGLRVSYGTKAGLTQLDMEQGQAQETGNPFDLMINGKGYFQVSYSASNSGQPNEIHFTRDGSFHLSPVQEKPGKYHLADANGGLLLDQNGSPIELDEQFEVNIDTAGQIKLRNKNGQGESFLSTQRVGMVDIKNHHLLKNMGDNQYIIDTAVLPNGATAANYTRLMNTGEIRVSSGFLEGSNVDLTKEMTDLMTSQRSFQMNARAVSYADQMMGIANGILK